MKNIPYTSLTEAEYKTLYDELERITPTLVTFIGKLDFKLFHPTIKDGALAIGFQPIKAGTFGGGIGISFDDLAPIPTFSLHLIKTLETSSGRKFHKAFIAQNFNLEALVLNYKEWLSVAAERFKMLTETDLEQYMEFSDD